MSTAFTPVQVAEMVALYGSGVASGRIAKAYGTDTSTVSRRLKSAGVHLRTLSQSRVVYRCDDGAFERSTDESAYWLGFLFADGCVTAQRRYTVSVALQERDRAHLDAFRTFLRTDAPIKYEQRTRSVRLTVSSETLVRSLLVRGCIPRKSNGIDYPAAGLFHRPSFVRGVFDGDGSIFSYHTPTGRVQTTVSVVGTPEFLLGLRDVLTADAALPRNKLYKAGRSETVKCLAWTGVSNVNKFGRYIYLDNGPCLERKRQRFMSAGVLP